MRRFLTAQGLLLGLPWLLYPKEILVKVDLSMDQLEEELESDIDSDESSVELMDLDEDVPATTSQIARMGFR
jgi:hypothetical protein